MCIVLCEEGKTIERIEGCDVSLQHVAYKREITIKFGACFLQYNILKNSLKSLLRNTRVLYVGLRHSVQLIC
jgi:hypothetical protein